MKLYKSLLCFCLIFCALQLRAQVEAPYTSLNNITLTIPGQSIRYSYFSNQLLFRLNQETAKLEMRVPISSFTPANTGSPQILLQELFLARQFPELVITFDLPMEMLQPLDPIVQNRRLEGVVLAQGRPRDIAPEVNFIPLRNEFTFSTVFDFNLRDPGIVLPQAYAGMVSGQVEVVIEKARWIYQTDTAR